MKITRKELFKLALSLTSEMLSSSVKSGVLSNHYNDTYHKDVIFDQSLKDVVRWAEGCGFEVVEE